MSVALENRTTYLYTNLVNLKMIVLKMHLKLIYLLLNNNMQHKQGKKHVKLNILLYFDDFLKINTHLENILYLYLLQM